MAWYEIVLTVIGSIFASTGFWSWVQSRNRRKPNEGKLLLGIAYSKIIQTAETYIQRGWIGTDEYRELYQYLYEPYKNMGGNGTAKRLMEQVEKLPNSIE
ncbi:MAG: hypothetical protein ACI3W7_04865 [Oscillospiraceae bacterium]